jgi:hypothetical protein
MVRIWPMVSRGLMWTPGREEPGVFILGIGFR